MLNKWIYNADIDYMQFLDYRNILLVILVFFNQYSNCNDKLKTKL